MNLGINSSVTKSLILKRISKIRYGKNKNGYFFIYDYNSVNLMHPIKPYLVGKNLSNLKDINGVPILKQMVAYAKNNGGYVEYVWDHPKTKKLENKIGYALGIQDWKWMVGTGVYLNDIENIIHNKLF